MKPYKTNILEKELLKSIDTKAKWVWSPITGRGRLSIDLVEMDEQNVKQFFLNKGFVDVKTDKPQINYIKEKDYDSKCGLQSSFFRELNYCMDHCIHHQSLIKIALLEQELIYLVDDNFGVAFSTQNYRKGCVS